MVKKKRVARDGHVTTCDVTLSHFLHNITSNGARTVLESSSSRQARSYRYVNFWIVFAHYCCVFSAIRFRNWELSSVVRCGYAQTAIFCGHYWARLHTAPLKDYTVVAVDRLTNAVAMSSAGFSLDLAQFKLGIDRKLAYCVKEVVWNVCILLW